MLWHFFSEDLQALFKEFPPMVCQMPQKHRKNRNWNWGGGRGRKEVGEIQKVKSGRAKRSHLYNMSTEFLVHFFRSGEEWDCSPDPWLRLSSTTPELGVLWGKSPIWTFPSLVFLTCKVVMLSTLQFFWGLHMDRQGDTAPPTYSRSCINVSCYFFFFFFEGSSTHYRHFSFILSL